MKYERQGDPFTKYDSSHYFYENICKRIMSNFVNDLQTIDKQFLSLSALQRRSTHEPGGCKWDVRKLDACCATFSPAGRVM